MVTVRRWYQYLVCAVSLHAVAWAVIALLRNLLVRAGEAPPAAVAFQIAVVLIGLPIFLVHWLWAERLARGDDEERENPLRSLYLYGNLAGFLGPIAANAYDFFATLLGLPFGRSSAFLAPAEALVHHLVAIVALALLWSYHRRVLAAGEAVASGVPGEVLRRLYLYGFSAAGVTLVTLAVVHLLRWILILAGTGSSISNPNMTWITDEVARLLVGLPLWLIFWGRAQRLYLAEGEEDQGSALRKFYLYVVVFVAVLGVVGNAALILAGLFRRMMDLPSVGDLRIPLPLVIGLAVQWAYHARVLRADAAHAGEVPRQSGLRRLYRYLVAAVGLAAFLVGLSGLVSALIRSLAGSFGVAVEEQLAWSAAALLAGLPVWLLPYRLVQAGAVETGLAGAEERRSVVRKIYLYFYLFLATMTVLSSGVYVLYRLISLALGERGTGSMVADLGQAVAFTLIGCAVWLIHGTALRGDGRLNRREEAGRLAGLRGVLVDPGEGSFGRAVQADLLRALPELSLDVISLPAAAGDGAASVHERLAGAGFIVGPWTMAVSGGAGGRVNQEFAQAVVASPVRKLLVPYPTAGWEWAGVDPWDEDALVRQTVRAVRQLAEGETVRAVRPPGVAAVIGIVAGGFLLLVLLAIPVLFFFIRGYI